MMSDRHIPVASISFSNLASLNCSAISAAGPTAAIIPLLSTTMDLFLTLSIHCLPVCNNLHIVHGLSTKHLLVVFGDHNKLLRILHNQSVSILHLTLQSKSLLQNGIQGWPTGLFNKETIESTHIFKLFRLIHYYRNPFITIQYIY